MPLEFLPQLYGRYYTLSLLSASVPAVISAIPPSLQTTQFVGFGLFPSVAQLQFGASFPAVASGSWSTSQSFTAFKLVPVGVFEQHVPEVWMS